MNLLQDYLARELPRINAFIAEAVGRLDPLVQPAASHVLSAGGKRLRPILTLLCARALGHGQDGPDPYPLACSLEFLHTATLLHDDILDGAELRRGKPAAHTVHGLTETILAGDAMLALANVLVASYGQPRLVTVMAEAVMRTAAGEVAEIASLGAPDLSREDYLRIITGKTAYLIQAACQSGAILAGAEPAQEEAAAALGLNLGIAFQLVDDALDYSSPASVLGKPGGGDLREGKLTLPLIAYLDALPPEQSDATREKIRAGRLSETDVDLIMKAIRDNGYAERTREEAGRYLDAARAALGRFPASGERDALDLSLAYVLTREK